MYKGVFKTSLINLMLTGIPLQHYWVCLVAISSDALDSQMQGIKPCTTSINATLSVNPKCLR